jgi:hypothetical protein
VGYAATVYEVLVASPGDVVEERALAAEVVDTWNRTHGESLAVQLRCIRWEKDATPAHGSHPQQILNAQLVDRADIVAAIFWSKTGTPTLVAASGTEEEIGRSVAAGKPVIMYFSERSYPADVDLRGVEDVRALKARYRDKCLYGTFRSAEEFKDKFLEHLSRAVHEIRRAPTENSSSPIPDPEEDDLLVLSALAEHRDETEGALDPWTVALTGVELMIRGDLTARTLNDTIEILAGRGDVSVRPFGPAERGGSPFAFAKVLITSQGYRRVGVSPLALPGRRLPPAVYVAEDYPESTGLHWEEQGAGFLLEWIPNYLVPELLKNGSDLVEREVGARIVYFRCRTVPAESILLRRPLRPRTVDDALALVRQRVDNSAAIKEEDGELVLRRPRTVGGGMNRPPVFITHDVVARGKSVHELLANAKILVSD